MPCMLSLAPRLPYDTGVSTDNEAALSWLHTLRNTERTGAFRRDPENNLARERALLARLGDPQRAYGITHIAGTKGKGSTAALLAAILRAAGIRTGLYTSPDLHTVRERIMVDGALIAPDEVARLAPLLRAAIEGVDTALGPFITFDALTALAFSAFRDAGVAHAVVEVGLGGRLDPTNVVAPLATAITSISYDHMAVLGATLHEIASEKAGIIKPGVPVVCSARAPAALEVIARTSLARGAPLLRVGPAGSSDCAYTYYPGAVASDSQCFSIQTPTGRYDALELALLGEHQLENATAAVALAEVLRARGLPLAETAIRQGLRAVRWPGRLQVVRQAPWVVVDGAHNADSLARLFVALRRHFHFARLVLVLGVMADKDLRGMAHEVALGAPDRVIVTAVAHPRAAPATTLAAHIATAAPALDLRIREPLQAALADAMRTTDASDLLCVAGSLYVVGAALRWLASQPGTPPGAIQLAGTEPQ